MPHNRAEYRCAVHETETAGLSGVVDEIGISLRLRVEEIVENTVIGAIELILPVVPQVDIHRHGIAYLVLVVPVLVFPQVCKGRSCPICVIALSGLDRRGRIL